MRDEGDRDPDAGADILAAVERRVGDSRYAGGWIDTEGRRVGVAVVDPSVQEVDEALAFGRETGWRVSVHAVSYSRVELIAFLIAFYEDLDPPANGTVAKCGWDPVLDRVVVELSRPDPEVESFFRSHIPDEALRFTYVGGRWHAAAL